MSPHTPADSLAPRPGSASRVSLSTLVTPDQTNPYGTLHGGVLLRLADECGAIAAIRHVGHGQITTAAIDSFTFIGPVFVGERVELVAEVTYAGRTSMEAFIEIHAEPLHKAEPRKVGVGYAVYVALCELDRKPVRVPPLLCETESDRRRDEEARARQAIRLARRAEALAHREELH
ncbi:putative acyl-CoA thioester hydrolase [Aquisphaera giovannonii]|uniref:Putative acyl-CoA thioester hydrolase n=1 Tax=Aquisphaera giovannonii TaxID=406548 RepID=A0A5B9VYW4_9BACT|nr:acyl-CoA thioesterase [Aquisphaera giovannonii]QEH33174.1 putative acyl-CoA thioester hydrolase [Aquisphaera giovannonii]